MVRGLFTSLLLTAVLHAQIVQQVIVNSAAKAVEPTCTDGSTANMIFRLDAWSIAPCSGGQVTTWTSGIGTNSAVPGPSSPTGPICSTSVFGIAPGVSFVAANNAYMSIATPLTIAQTGNVTEMAVIKPTLNSSYQSIIGGEFSGSFAWYNSYQTTASPTQGANVGFVSNLGGGTATFTSGDIYQINVSYTTSAAPTFRFNKAADATIGGTTGAITYQSDVIGQVDGTATLNAYVGALYVFSPALTTSQIEAWEATLSCEYPGA